MVTIKPYLVKAAYQWTLDIGHTPHLLVNTEMQGVTVPSGHIEDGRIVLNIDPQATSNLVIGDELIEFNARFSGKPFSVSVPISAVLGVYSRENGEGISFPVDAGSDGGKIEDAEAPLRGKPDLKIIK